MNYVILYYDDDSQVVIEALGPQTVIGIVADIVRGSYNQDGRKLIKVEIGPQLRGGFGVAQPWRIATEGQQN